MIKWLLILFLLISCKVQYIDTSIEEIVNLSPRKAEQFIQKYPDKEIKPLLSTYYLESDGTIDLTNKPLTRRNIKTIEKHTTKRKRIKSKFEHRKLRSNNKKEIKTDKVRNFKGIIRYIFLILLLITGGYLIKRFKLI